MNQNYRLILDKTLAELKKNGTRPKLLLHACCAPCSSAVIEELALYFDITLYFYNPNIYPKEEYDFRLAELHRLIKEMSVSDVISKDAADGIGKIKIAEGKYDPDVFFTLSKGYEKLPEGDMRCEICYKLRLSETARYALEQGFDYFCTTLSVSPYKNAQKLNDIGSELSELYGVPYLTSDFKKRNGYKRSCELSRIFDLYRQDFCGCPYSKAARESE